MVYPFAIVVQRDPQGNRPKQTILWDPPWRNTQVSRLNESVYNRPSRHSSAISSTQSDGDMGDMGVFYGGARKMCGFPLNTNPKGVALKTAHPIWKTNETCGR